MLCCARYDLISVVRYDSCLLRLVSPYLRILLPLLTPLGLGQGVRAMCSRAILCSGLYAHSRIYFAISTDEHAIIHAIIVAGPTWLRPAKFLASASGIVNIKRRKQMTP